MIRSELLTPNCPQPRRLRFTVDDYYKMIEMGMIEDYEKAEIIAGEIVPKRTIGDKHAAVVDKLARLLIKALPDEVLVRVQNPLRIGDFDEPEPDFVLADLTKYDGNRHPRPEETLVVIEVVDASLKNDRSVKLPLYAKAGLGEVWIVNLRDDVVEIHQEPTVDIYQHVKVFKRDERVASTSLPQVSFDVDSILG